MESFDQLLAGELDLAVRSREALPHGLRFEPLFASDRMLIVPRGHELAGKKRPTLRDLARHAFVIPPGECPWAGDAGGYRRLIRNGGRDAVAGGGGEEGGVGGNPRRH
jgi:DNA-binding transcriptional LysR family regulator